MTTQADLDALAAAVRFFTDQEIPNVSQWNVDPNVLKSALTRTGVGFTDVETSVSQLTTIVNGITKPDGSLAPVSEWIDEAATPTYVNATTFTLPGDRTTSYRAGHRLQATVAGGSKVVVTVQAVAYSAGQNITTFTLTAAQLDSALSKIAYSVVRESAPAARTQDILDLAVTVAKIADLAVSTAKLANLAVTGAKLADAPSGITTTKLNDGAVTNLKVGYKSLQGSERIVDNSINGSVSLTAASVTGDKMAANSVGTAQIQPNSINGGHIADKSLWAASELADYSIAWNNVARGHIRGSWNGVQNEIGQKTIWADVDVADASVSNRNIAAKTIWINDKCGDKSLLGFNTIVDQSINIAQLNQGQTTAAVAQAGINSGGGAWTGWRTLGGVQFNLSRYGWVRIFADACGFCIETTTGGGSECWFRILQNGYLVMQRHYLSTANGVVSQWSPSMQYIGWWGPGNYYLSVDAYIGYAYLYAYDGVINATQEA